MTGMVQFLINHTIAFRSCSSFPVFVAVVLKLCFRGMNDVSERLMYYMSANSDGNYLQKFKCINIITSVCKYCDPYCLLVLELKRDYPVKISNILNWHT